MARPFREHHTLNILQMYEEQTAPLDLFLSNYFRTNKSVGAKDRKVIADAVYGIIRWRGLLDYLIASPLSWEQRYRQFLQLSPKKYLSQEKIPLHIRLSFPKHFFHILKENVAEDKLVPFCMASNESAPTTVRINTLKITRDALLTEWNQTFSVSACPTSPSGITFHKKVNFFALPAFKMGLFEVQDEASQLIAHLVDAQPGDLVLDFCAGSGGKSLAIAPQMQHRGQLFLHDIRKHALLEARKRLKRAGIQNAQIVHSDSPNKAHLKHRMDWVLVDAPCSGTGTLRRNPDMKWKFNQAALDRLIEQQRAIFQEALEFVKPGGKIVYATCSVLASENEMQAAFFEKTYALDAMKAPFASFPSSGAMDGFFGIVFKTAVRGK